MTLDRRAPEQSPMRYVLTAAIVAALVAIAFGVRCSHAFPLDVTLDLRPVCDLSATHCPVEWEPCPCCPPSSLYVNGIARAPLAVRGAETCTPTLTVNTVVGETLSWSRRVTSGAPCNVTSTYSGYAIVTSPSPLTMRTMGGASGIREVQARIRQQLRNGERVNLLGQRDPRGLFGGQ
jgi:hypothetical protein